MTEEEAKKRFGHIKGKLRVSQLILDNMDQLDEDDFYGKAEAILIVARLQEEAKKEALEIPVNMQ